MNRGGDFGKGTDHGALLSFYHRHRQTWYHPGRLNGVRVRKCADYECDETDRERLFVTWCLWDRCG